MAPNLNRHAVLLAPQSLPTLQASAFKDYLPVAPQRALDSTSYWSWPSDVPTPTVDVFAVDHIVENLVRASTGVHEGKDSNNDLINPEHDSYWAEAESHQALLPQEAAPQDYWNESCHERSASDTYWNTDTQQHPQQHQPTRTGAVNYWDEPRHGRTTSDLYWAEATSKPVCGYWSETRHERNATDAYWVW